ncbi:MAG: dihydrolipoyl dehydrogenase [Verrucomicrobiota bacterium]
MDYDLIVVGGGPAGYVGAIRASQLGAKVAVVEKERAGGTCLNWGCIPSKALLKSAELYHQMQHATDYGLGSKEVDYDFAKVMARSRGVSDTMAKGVEFLFKGKKVDYFVGNARITKPTEVHISPSEFSKDDDDQIITGERILLCTGCLPREIPGLKTDGKVVHTSRTILDNQQQMKKLVVIGAGAIGCEFAYFFNAFGTEVTIVEMLPNLLPVEDDEVSKQLKRSFEKSGIEVLTETKVEKTEVGKKGVKITVSGAESKTIEADAVLVAIGVVPNLEGVLGEGVTLKTDQRGYVETDSRYMTNVQGVYAAGDIIGPPWLAHVASHEAIEAVEGMFMKDKQPHKVDVFPGCTYCQPQVASIGLTERAAKEEGLEYTVSKFPYRASGKAVAMGEPEGFIKLITGEEHGEILGAHIIGAEATELVAELGLAVKLEATLEEITATIHAHPTLAEMVHEAALVGEGNPIHI